MQGEPRSDGFWDRGKPRRDASEMRATKQRRGRRNRECITAARISLPINGPRATNAGPAIKMHRGSLVKLLTVQWNEEQQLKDRCSKLRFRSTVRLTVKTRLRGSSFWSWWNIDFFLSLFLSLFPSSLVSLRFRSSVVPRWVVVGEGENLLNYKFLTRARKFCKFACFVIKDRILNRIEFF